MEVQVAVRVQHANNFYRDLVIGGLILALPQQMLATTTSATIGISQFETGSDEEAGYRGTLQTVELAHEGNYLSAGEPGYTSSIRLAHTADPSSTGNSLSLDQGFGGGYSVGVTGSKVSSPKDGEKQRGYDSTRMAGRVGFWLRSMTLRVGLEGSSQKTTKEARDFDDTDGFRIRVAADATGSTATLRLTHLTTPTTILTSNMSQTRATGRPVALSYGAELRQYVVGLKAAFHIGLDRYLEQGEIERETDYGRISSHTQTFRYHQRLPKDFVLSSITRWHQENELPRSVETEDIKKRHISEVVSLKWRSVEGSWTDECSEIGVFAGFFTRRETQDNIITTDFVRMLGVQFKGVL